MFKVFAQIKGKLRQIGPDFTAEGPAKEFADMCKRDGYTGVVVKVKCNILDRDDEPVLTKTGRQALTTKIVY